jgi:hemolysin III
MSTTNERLQSFGEELANAISHGFGAVSILVATPFLLVAAFDKGGALAVTCASIFAATAVLLYLSSALYHALKPGRVKSVCKAVDHSAIFLLIAGTYTPFTLGALRGPWGWSLFGAVWALALVGIAAEALGGVWRNRVSMCLYLAMGWLVLLAIQPLVEHVAAPGIWLLLAGGIAYTVGVGFYALKRIPYAHLIWHLFVLAGTALHFVAVMHYAA